MLSIAEIYMKILNSEWVDWFWISAHEELSDEFISEFCNQLDWEVVCQNRILTEEFIEKWEIYVDWKQISQYQYLTEEFLKKWNYKINIEKFKNNLKITTQMKIKFIKETVC